MLLSAALLQTLCLSFLMCRCITRAEIFLLCVFRLCPLSCFVHAYFMYACKNQTGACEHLQYRLIKKMYVCTQKIHTFLSLTNHSV